MSNVLPSLIVLGAAALAALFLAWHRRSPPEKKPQRRTAAGVLALTAGVQSIHFALGLCLFSFSFSEQNRTRFG